MRDLHINCTIDGQTIAVEKGTTIIQAAQQLGIEIPHYCYHPGLPTVGSCRMCMVKVEKAPKLQIACYTQVSDGMVVTTGCQEVKTARQAVLEFLLHDHPLDCPVCDQAGECFLQDYYMDYGLYDPTFVEFKHKKKKANAIGPHIMLDQERCVLCSRCTRFCETVSKSHELGIFQRGDRSIVDLYPGVQLDNPYSGNIADICPVGALTDRDFRFKCRVWYLRKEKSICPGCSMGCNIEIHFNTDRPHKAAGDIVMRLKPRRNDEVNQHWICDEGRYGYKSINENRIVRPFAKENGEHRAIEWDEAYTRLLTVFENLKNGGVKTPVVILGAHLTCEDMALIDRCFRQAFGWSKIAVAPARLGPADDFLIKADRSANRNGARVLQIPVQDQQEYDRMLISIRAGVIDSIFSFGIDVVGDLGDKWRETREKISALAYYGSNWNSTADEADLVFPTCTYAEKNGVYINCDMRLQRLFQAFPPIAESKPEWEIIADLAASLGIEEIKAQDVDEIFLSWATKYAAAAPRDFDEIPDRGVSLTQQDRSAEKTAATEQLRLPDVD